MNRFIQINIPAPTEVPSAIQRASAHLHMAHEHLYALTKVLNELGGTCVHFHLELTTDGIEGACTLQQVLLAMKEIQQNRN